MGTIEQKLSYLLQTKSAIRNAIQARGVNVTDEDTFRSYAKKIEDIQGKVYYLPSIPSKRGVDFKDYDGAILHSYTKEEFLALTEMPVLPERPKLICQGWNWSLEDAKAYVQEYGRLDIGATYITDDGKTRFYITIDNETRNKAQLYFSQTVGNGVIVDWGDGSETETFSNLSKTINHDYERTGDYIITFMVLDGELKLSSSSGSSSNITSSSVSSSGTGSLIFSSKLRKIEIGSGVTSIGDYTFQSCYSLSSVTIPNGVTSIGNSAFRSCYSLSSVTIPNGVTSLGKLAFYYCYSLSSVTIPNGVTSIGDSTFYYCYSLSSVTIPNSVTSFGIEVFNACYSLSSVTLPNSVTSFGFSTFRSCYSLSSVTIPNGLTGIGDNMFYSCYSLPSVTIPNSVTSISSSAFNSCTAVGVYDFRTHTSVPVLHGASFKNIPSDCKIVVPDELYDEWIAATNWSSCVNYIVKASMFNA